MENAKENFKVVGSPNDVTLLTSSRRAMKKAFKDMREESDRRLIMNEDLVLNQPVITYRMGLMF